MFFQIKEQMFGYTVMLTIWRGIMCLYQRPKRDLAELSVEQVISTLRPYGITKDEAEQVYNKINGGKNGTEDR